MGKQVLEGVKILDISAVIAGPTSTAFLAEFGADVIRVEGDAGKSSRNFPVMNHILNRNKRCINLDFHHPEAIELFYKLVEWADVVVTNFRPSALKRWGIDYEDVVKVKPDIIYVHFSAYGRTGHLADRPGYARVSESFSGLPYITGDPDPDGHPQLAGTWIVDGIGGIHVAYSTMLALYHKKCTGEGQLVDVGLYEPLFRIMEEVILNYSLNGVVKQRMGNMQIYSVPNNMYKSKDGEWVVMPTNGNNMVERLTKAMGREELMKDPKWETAAARVENREEVDGVVRDWMASKTRAEILELFDKYGVAGGPVNSIKDVFEEDHFWERGSLVKVFYPDLNKEVVEPGIIPHLSKTPGEIKWVGPEYGAHNDEVYLDLLGLDKAKYEELKEKGVIG